MHSKKFAHGDLKPTNILIDKDGEIKISDLGHIKFIPEGQSNYMQSWDGSGTVQYFAPEMDKRRNESLQMKDFFQGRCMESWSNFY